MECKGLNSRLNAVRAGRSHQKGLERGCDEQKANNLKKSFYDAARK